MEYYKRDERKIDIPEVEPEEDEIMAIKEAKENKDSLISHDDIKWE